MITTNDEHLFKTLMMLRTHGISRENMPPEKGGWYHEMQILGYNYRLPDLNCALGITQLAKAEQGLQRRKAIAARYLKELNGLGDIQLQKQPEGFENAWHLFVIQTARRKELYDFLRTKNIFTQVHYIPVHRHPYYEGLGFKKGDFPVAENYYDRCLSLPLYPGLTDEQQTYVIEQLKSFYRG